VSLWLAVRRVAWCVVTALVVTVIIVAIGGVAVPVPALGAFEDAAWPISLIAPVAIAIVLAWSLGAGEPRFEGMAVRPVTWMDLGFVICLAGGMALLALAAGTLGWIDLAGETARNTFGYVGLMLVGRWLIGGDASAVIPVGYIVLAAFFGGPTASSSAWWAWLVKPADDPLSWTLVLGLFAAGSVLLLVGWRPMPSGRLAG
jgi:hypothetical protein